MNHWSHMLAALPTSAQRAIARFNRISLPRHCSTPERHDRIRAALCHARTVRATYATMDYHTQQAVQALRHQRGGISKSELEARWDAARNWAELAADPRPRSITECLLLHGWLIPRPATHCHPARYLLASELRRWLPQPLYFDRTVAAAPAPYPPILHAVATLLILGAEQPLPVCKHGRLRRATVRTALQRLPNHLSADGALLIDFTVALLCNRGLLAPANGNLTTTIAGQRFLRHTPADQLAMLRHSWLHEDQPDRWLRPHLRATYGINWPALRRKLWTWGAALPADRAVPLPDLYPALVVALGPLADAHTHGFRHVDRAPWQPKRAAAIFATALHGPLRWLGLVHITNNGTDQPLVARNSINHLLPKPSSPAWRYDTGGLLHIPHSDLSDHIFALLPFMEWHSTDATATTWHITPSRLAHAQAQGYSVAHLRTTLEAIAGLLPAAWQPLITAAPALHFATTPVLIAEPTVLRRAARHRSIRRYLGTRPAAGIALVEPAHASTLQRACQRHGFALAEAPSVAAPADPPAPFTAPGEIAALLAACQFYRQHAPPNAQLLPHVDLESRLTALLPHSLRAALTQTVRQFAAPSAQNTATLPPPVPDQSPVRTLLQAAMHDQQTVLIRYCDNSGTWSERCVQPRALHEIDDHWYVRAYCTARRAERTFRVDRIAAVERTRAAPELRPAV